MKHYNLIILGSGPAGLTAAIYSSRANLSPLLLHGPLSGGQLTTTTDVENFPGFPEGIQGPELMENMTKQAERFGTTVLSQTVSEVNLKQKPFYLKTDSSEFTCDTLIIATGAAPKYLGVPGEKELLGYGVSTCATCDGAFFRDEVISVIGGGDSACEEANFLSKFGKKVFLIHRRDSLRASKIMQDRVFKNPKIEIIWNSELLEVKGNRDSGVKSILLKDTENGNLSDLECAAAFIAIGHTPNSKLFTEFLDLNEQGYIKTNESNSMKTSVPGVFVCGDVQDSIFRQAITAAGTGCMAAIEAERYLEEVHT
jgi:thioredoxin reductase (NADPH)